MPNKLNAYIDLAKLQGARRMFIKGKDDFGNTHLVKGSTTKAERESPQPPDLPFLGNAREFEAGGQRSARPADGAPVTTDDGPLAEGLADDDIRF